MHDEDAFLRAIQAEPLNDLRKLVYADWLQEQGREGEATFIRDTAEGTKSNGWTRWHTPDERVGKTWWDLYSGAVRIWEARTLLALGRLQGLLEGLASGNNHTSDIAHDYTATLEPLIGSAERYREELASKGVRLTEVDEWQTTLRDEIARWIGSDQGTFGRRSVARRAHQTAEGCRWTADRVLRLVAELLTVDEVWRQEPLTDERWGIDFSVFLLIGSDRTLTLNFYFDD